jgi:alpha-L-fucosidase
VWHRPSASATGAAPADSIRSNPWQTDTCIGDWHYSRAIFQQNRYATVATIFAMLTGMVSKNDNLMPNIPLRGDGSIARREEAFLAGLTAWMDVNSEWVHAPPAPPHEAADAARRRPTRPRRRCDRRTALIMKSPLGD